MKEMNEGDIFDAGTGRRRYMEARRERRRIRRHNMMMYVMLPVMVVALSISLHHTFVPRRATLPENARENMDFLPSGFFESIENASARLDSLVRKYLPDTLAANEFIQQMAARFDSLDPKSDILADPERTIRFLMSSERKEE